MPFLPFILILGAVAGVAAIASKKKAKPLPKPLDVPPPADKPGDPRGLTTTTTHYNGIKYGVVTILDVRKATDYLLELANARGLERGEPTRGALLQLLFDLQPEYRQIPLEQLSIKIAQLPEPNDDEMSQVLHMVERNWPTLGQLELEIDEIIDQRGW